MAYLSMKQQLIKEVRKLQEIVGIEEIVVKPTNAIKTIFLIVRHDGDLMDEDSFVAFKNREAAEEYRDNLDLDSSILELDLH